jgi:hypothetical protein
VQICGHTRKDQIRNKVIRDRLGVAPVNKKLVQHRPRWFGNSGILRTTKVDMGRGGKKRLEGLECP